MRIVLALAIVLAGVPAHASSAPDAAGLANIESSATADHQRGCANHSSDSDDNTQLVHPRCDSRDCCGEECRMACAGLMLVLPLDLAHSSLAAKPPSLTTPRQLHLSAVLSGLLRPPQA